MIALDYELDTSTAAGELAAGALIEIGDWERGRIADRTRPGLTAIRATAPRNHASVRDDPELSARISAMRAQGMSLQAISDTLNAEGVPTLRGGTHWRPSSVQAATGYKRPPAKPAGGRRAPAAGARQRHQHARTVGQRSDLTSHEAASQTGNRRRAGAQQRAPVVGPAPRDDRRRRPRPALATGCRRGQRLIVVKGRPEARGSERRCNSGRDTQDRPEPERTHTNRDACSSSLAGARAGVAETTALSRQRYRGGIRRRPRAPPRPSHPEAGARRGATRAPAAGPDHAPSAPAACRRRPAAP